MAYVSPSVWPIAPEMSRPEWVAYRFNDLPCHLTTALATCWRCIQALVWVRSAKKQGGYSIACPRKIR